MTRRVMVMKWVVEKTPLHCGMKTVTRRAADVEADFHAFGQETDEDGAQPVAIVEFDDGRVDTVLATMIRFLDKEPKNAADEN